MRRYALWAMALVFTVSVTAVAQVSIMTTGNLLLIANYNAGLGSSDQVSVVQVEANGSIVLDEGHAVKYFQNKTADNLGDSTDWTADDFDDSGWDDGENSVGYNSSQTTEVVDDDDQGSIYSRMWFDIPGADGVSEMTVRVDYDDAFILWINGMEVVRANVGTDDSGLNWDHDPTSHESTNKPGPDATRWAEPVSNLFGAGDDNPNGAIVDFTFAVAFNPVTAVEAKGKLATVWGDLRK